MQVSSDGKVAFLVENEDSAIPTTRLEVVDLLAPRIERRQLISGFKKNSLGVELIEVVSHDTFITPKYLAAASRDSTSGMNNAVIANSLTIFPAVSVKGSRRKQFSAEKKFVKVTNFAVNAIVGIDDDTNRMVVLSDDHPRLYLYQIELPKIQYKAEYDLAISGKVCTIHNEFHLHATGSELHITVIGTRLMLQYAVSKSNWNSKGNVFFIFIFCSLDLAPLWAPIRQGNV